MEKRPSTTVYALVAAGGAVVTGAASALPWVYETFWAQEYRLEYSVQPPIEVVLSDGPRGVWIVEAKNTGRRALTAVSILLPADVEQSHISLQQIKGRIVDGVSTVERLLPSETLRLTALTPSENGKLEVTVRSNEILGSESEASNSKPLVLITAALTALTAAAYAALTYLFVVRRRIFTSFGDTNTILLVASLFGYERLMEQTWRAKMWMAYHGAAELVYLDTKGVPDERSVKALFALCVSPTISKQEEKDVIRIASELVGWPPEKVAVGVGHLKAASDLRSDIVDAIWAIKKMPYEDIQSLVLAN